MYTMPQGHIQLQNWPADPHAYMHTQYMPFTPTSMQHASAPVRPQVAQTELQQAQMRYNVAGDPAAARNIAANRQLSAKNKVPFVPSCMCVCVCVCVCVYLCVCMCEKREREGEGERA